MILLFLLLVNDLICFEVCLLSFNLDFKTLQKQIQKLSNSSTIDLPNLFIDMIEHLKKGGKIYIKKANRGKFTASAKRAGQTVQEHARSVLNDTNATQL